MHWKPLQDGPHFTLEAFAKAIFGQCLNLLGLQSQPELWRVAEEAPLAQGSTGGQAALARYVRIIG